MVWGRGRLRSLPAIIALHGQLICKGFNNVHNAGKSHDVCLRVLERTENAMSLRGMKACLGTSHGLSNLVLRMSNRPLELGALGNAKVREGSGVPLRNSCSSREP